MDRQSTYALSLFGTDRDENERENSNSQVQQYLVDFILDFHIDNVYIYRCVRPPHPLRCAHC